MIPEILPTAVPTSAVITVTCNRDRWTFQRQYSQMVKLCMPTTWYVLINEPDDKDWLQWFGDIRKFEPPIGLNIVVLTMQDLPLKDKLIRFNGYWRQQFYKIILSSMLDYDVVVILDSKNWLIRPWHPLFHQNSHRTDLPVSCAHFYANRILCERAWGVKFTTNTSNTLPPVSWEPKEVKSMLKTFDGIENFIDQSINFFRFSVPEDPSEPFIFGSTDTLSEFMIYDYWIQYQQKVNLLTTEIKGFTRYNSAIRWKWDEFDWEAFDNIFLDAGTYWITIKWHLEKIPEGLRDLIWDSVALNTHNRPEYAVGWKRFKGNPG